MKAKAIWPLIWRNKQLIMGSVTTAVSSLATAGFISAAASVKITTVTGVIVMIFAVVYTVLHSDDPVPPAPPTGG